jgi:hypothetical protein
VIRLFQIAFGTFHGLIIKGDIPLQGIELIQYLQEIRQGIHQPIRVGGG